VQKTTTKCDNCKAESENPEQEGWNKLNLHPWGKGEADAESDWIIRDICPGCTARIAQWLTGTLTAVFRKPKNSKEE